MKANINKIEKIKGIFFGCYLEEPEILKCQTDLKM